MAEVLVAMTEIEIIRVVAEVLVIAGAVVAGMWRLLVQGRRLLAEVQETRAAVSNVATGQKELAGRVELHIEDDAKQFRSVGERLAGIEGTLNERARHMS